jgi:predicted DNA binding CopG/RHH family protein
MEDLRELSLRGNRPSIAEGKLKGEGMDTKVNSRRGRTDVAAQRRRDRLTVQLSSSLLDAVEGRAEEEALPVAAFVRRAVTQLVKEEVHGGPIVFRDLSEFEEARRTGERGPMRQWPNGVSYVVDIHIAEDLRRLAEANDVDASALAREALVRDLGRPSTVRRVQPRDEVGFTTSGAPRRGRASQHVMNAAWRSTNT